MPFITLFLIAALVAVLQVDVGAVSAGAAHVWRFQWHDVLPYILVFGAALDSPWMTAAEAATYLKRGRRFVLREIHAGRLRAAIVGGRREILTRRDWCDQFIEDLAKPIMLHRRLG